MNNLKRHKRLEEFVRLMWSHKSQIISFMPNAYPIVKYKNKDKNKHGDIISTAELCEIFVTSKDSLALKYCYTFGTQSGTQEQFNKMINKLENASLNKVASELNNRRQKPYIDIQYSGNLLTYSENRKISNYEQYEDYKLFSKYTFLNGKAKGYKVDWDLLEKSIFELNGKTSVQNKKEIYYKKDKIVKMSQDFKIDNLTKLFSKTNEFDPNSEIDAREKVERSIALRRGQSTFRQTLIKLYEGKCAITGTDVLSALEAAHIKPYKGEYWNHPTNGILLRADIHTLFDLKLITIEPKSKKVVLSNDLKDTYYSKYNNWEIFQVKEDEFKPDEQALKDHYNKFKDK